MSDNPISSLVQQGTADVHRILSKSTVDFQSYANQLQLCRNMTQNLTDLDSEILRITQTYHASIQQLEADQYVDEGMKNIGQIWLTFAPQAEDLSQHLRIRHLKYIQDREVAITAAADEELGK